MARKCSALRFQSFFMKSLVNLGSNRFFVVIPGIVLVFLVD